MNNYKKFAQWIIPLFLIFTIGLFAPFEIYILNADEFWFNLSNFWYIPIIVSGAGYVLLVCIIKFLKGNYQKYFLTFLFAIGLCCYIQGNFLNLKLGVLNGGDIRWSNYAVKVLWNILIWFILVTAVLVIVSWKEVFVKVIIYLATFLTAIQMVTLTVLIIPNLVQGEENEVTSFLSAENLYEVGDDNIIVFLLDMYDNQYFENVLKEDTELYNELQGFTYYSNCAGGYSTTDYSMVLLSTGHYYHNELGYANKREWQDSITSKNWYIENLKDDDYKIYTYFTMGSLLPTRQAGELSENYVEGKMVISNKLHFSFDLYQLVACKYLPDCLKPFLWMNGTEFNTWKSVKTVKGETKYEPYSSSNSDFKLGLEENGITVGENQKQYKFIYLTGTHYPYEIDEEGNKVEENYDDLNACARGCMSIMKEYINKLKEAGKYDSTSIVILADHGYYWDGALTSPLLLVKPKDASGRLNVSNKAVSQIDFAATVLDLAGLDYSEQEGISVLEESSAERCRYFYQYNLQEGTEKRRLIEYTVDNSGNTRDCFSLTDVEYTPSGEKISHSKYCETCLSGNDQPVTGKEGVVDVPLLQHIPATNYPYNTK